MAEGRRVGPFPAGRDPDEYDRLRRRVLWMMPGGLYVLGSRAGDRRNLMTLNWATQVSTDPKLLAVSIESGAVTNQLVADGGAFTLNVLARDDRALARKFVKPLEDDGEPGLLAGFPVHSAVTGAPILDQAVAWLDCIVRQTVDCGSHVLYLGEVVDCDGAAGDDTEVLRMEDTRMSYGG